MKGIKKLFFGLIFMTLVGVGFKVDVKAGVSFVEPDFSEENATVYAKFSGTIPKEESHEFTLELPNDDVQFYTYYDSETKEYSLEKIDDFYDWDLNGSKFWVEVPIITKDQIYDEMSPSGDSQTRNYRVNSTGLGSGTYKVSAYPVKIEAWSGGRDVSKTDKVEFGDPSPDDALYNESSKTFWLLKGDLASITIAYDGLGNVSVQKTENVWDYNDDPGSSCVVTVDGKGKKYTAKVTLGVSADFIEIPELDLGRKVGLNYWSEEFDYYYDGDDIENAAVYLGNQKLSPSNYYFDDGKFRFKAVGTVGTKTLKITLNGASKEYKNIQIIDPSKLSFKIDSPITTYEDYYVIVTPTAGGAKIEDFRYGEDYDEESYEGVIFEAETYNGSKIKITGTSLGTGDKLQVLPIFDVDLYKDEGGEYSEWSALKRFAKTVVINVKEAGEVDIKDDVYVINGMKIKLNKFVEGYDSSMSTLPVGVTNNASSYISVPSSGELGKIEITGKSSGHKKDGIDVMGDTANVTVYPKPSINLDSSSSSSSSSSYTNASYKFTVKMPYGDYHDDWTVDSLGTVEFTVISSSGDEKSLKKVSSGSTSSSNSVAMSRSFTTTITAREMADALGRGSDSVKIRAYAYDGDKRDDKVYAEYSLSYNTGSSSSSSSSSSTSGKGGSGGSGSEYDDVPKTGESKTDIWVLWMVLFIAILGAGFMIWKRFGLVRAIAEAEEEYEAAEQEERVEAARKEKEDKINMIKDLRNL